MRFRIARRGASGEGVSRLPLCVVRTRLYPPVFREQKSFPGLSAASAAPVVYHSAEDAIFLWPVRNGISARHVASDNRAGTCIFSFRYGKKAEKCRGRGCGANLFLPPGHGVKSGVCRGMRPPYREKTGFFFFAGSAAAGKKTPDTTALCPVFCRCFFITSFLLMFFYISRSGKRRFRFAGTGIPDLFFPFPVRVFHALFMHEK